MCFDVLRTNSRQTRKGNSNIVSSAGFSYRLAFQFCTLVRKEEGKGYLFYFSL